MGFISNNITKILGAIQTTLMTMIAAGQFDGLLSPTTTRWIGIFGMLVGAATTAVGFQNTSNEKVADAITTALNTPPPKEQP